MAGQKIKSREHTKYLISIVRIHFVDDKGELKSF